MSSTSSSLTTVLADRNRNIEATAANLDDQKNDSSGHTASNGPIVFRSEPFIRPSNIPHGSEENFDVVEKASVLQSQSVAADIAPSSGVSAISSADIPHSIENGAHALEVTDASQGLPSEANIATSSGDDSLSAELNNFPGIVEEMEKVPESIIQIDFFEESSQTASVSIQFLSSRSTLYGVVEALFEYYLDDRLQEAIYSHVWIIKMGRSSSYIGPFPESAFDGSQKPCCPTEPVPLDSLNLTTGQEIKFSYDLGCTTRLLWRVASILPASDHDLSDRSAFPKKVIEPPQAGPVVRGVFLTENELLESKTFRLKKDATVGTVWSSRQDKAVLAQSAAWSSEERKALCLLLYADITFAKAWSNYLEPTLLSRSKGATSVTWYATRNSIQECDSLHNEKNWLHSGGRIESETTPPTKEVLLQRTEDILRSVRLANLNWKPPDSTKKKRRRDDDSDGGSSMGDDDYW